MSFYFCYHRDSAHLWSLRLSRSLKVIDLITVKNRCDFPLLQISNNFLTLWLSLEFSEDNTKHLAYFLFDTVVS